MIILIIILIIVITVILLYRKTYEINSHISQPVIQPTHKLPKCGGYNKPKKYIPRSYNIVTSCTTSPLRIFKMKETLNSIEIKLYRPHT